MTMRIDPKERKKIPRQVGPEQDPTLRIRNFEEVPLGYTPAMAQLEALRCIQCPKPKCVPGCPVQVRIPEFIQLIAQGDFLGAARKIKESSALPAICGRVCPQEELCEKACVLGIKGVPVAIGCLERFAADYERNSGMVDIPPKAAPTGRKIAIVGAGPAGLTAASDLARLGHEVVIFEALHEPGGVLFYGIPQFRLPKDVVRAEIRYLERLGISIRTNSVIGKIATVDELLEQGGYDALFIATGAGLPYFLGIGGENLNGVYTANEFLTRINLMGAWRFPEYDTPLHAHKRFAVIGGGNTALDAARTARRLPTTEEVTLVYRRSRAEMPARKEEVAHAEAEGIHFLWLTAPVKFLGEKGWVNAVECLHMELGESDESGRRHPVPEPNSNFLLEEDAVIIAVGNGVNPLIGRTTPALRTTRRGTIEVLDPSTGQTAREGVFAGGDIVTGAATVIEAMGSGKRAAVGIHQYLTYQNPKPPTESTDPSTSK